MFFIIEECIGININLGIFLIKFNLFFIFILINNFN